MRVLNIRTGPTDTFPPECLGGATGAGLLACFPPCQGQLQLYRGTFSTHLACLGAAICAAMFFPRAQLKMSVSLCGKTVASKRVVFKGLRRLIKC